MGPYSPGPSGTPTDDDPSVSGTQAPTIRAPSKGAIPKAIGRRDAPKRGKAGTKSSTNTKPQPGAMIISGPRQSSTQPISTAAGEFVCESCEATYRLRSSLARHRKTCGTRDRTRCQYCSAAFDTFGGVRQYERLSHPEQYREELEAQLRDPEPILFAKIAKVEVQSRKGSQTLYSEIIAATGLTQNQIRNRREKPEYKAYLELAKADVRARGISLPARPASLSQGSSKLGIYRDKSDL